MGSRRTRAAMPPGEAAGSRFHASKRWQDPAGCEAIAPIHRPGWETTRDSREGGGGGRARPRRGGSRGRERPPPPAQPGRRLVLASSTQVRTPRPERDRIYAPASNFLASGKPCAGLTFEPGVCEATMNPLKQLNDYGQSVWMDYIRRNLITSGELRRLINFDGVTGLTSNPTIFEKAIDGSTDYDQDLRALLDGEERRV